MPKNPHAAPKLPLCEITDVFCSEAQNELIEYVTDSPLMQRASTGYVSRTLKSYSAPKPHILGKCDLRITTVIPNHGGECQVFSFPGATITEIITGSESGKSVWLTHFWTYAPPKSCTVAEAGRKGGKKTGRKGFAAMNRAEGDRIRNLAKIARKTRKMVTTIDRSPGTAALARKARKAVREAVKIGYCAPEIRP